MYGRIQSNPIQDNKAIVLQLNSTLKKPCSWQPVPLLVTNKKGKNGSSDRFLFFSSKITSDSDCSPKIKRCLLLGRKAITNLDSVLKSRDITLSTKVCIVKAMVFPIVMCGCENWTTKKAESQRIDAFKLWCWRRLLRAPWTAKRPNQSTLKEINPGHSLEGLMLKLQFFGP